MWSPTVVSPYNTHIDFPTLPRLCGVNGTIYLLHMYPLSFDSNLKPLVYTPLYSDFLFARTNHYIIGFSPFPPLSPGDLTNVIRLLLQLEPYLMHTFAFMPVAFRNVL